MKFLLLRGNWNLPSLLMGSILTIFALVWINYLSYAVNMTQYLRMDFARLSERNENESLRIPLVFHEHNSGLDMENRTDADYLRQKIRVLCWIMTMPENHETKAIHVKNTWGKRCNKLIFMSSINNDSLPSINLGFKESRNKLWGKTKKAFKHVYANHLKDYDWFLKADDDTYVIVENLRYLLSAYDPDKDAIYFGSRFNKFSKQGYMSGGGGYVLSRKALKLFAEHSLPNSKKCKVDDSGAEDAEMGKCLNNVGVMAGDSRDSHAHGKFFPFVPQTHLIPGEIGKDMWYWDYIYYPIVNGPKCCSDLAVSFHYVNPKKMYELEYLIYHLHPYGVHHSDPFPPPLPPDKKSVPQRVLEQYTNKTKNFTTQLAKT